MSVIGFSRAIGPVPIDCVLSEKHTTEIEITKNVIETGAEVNDHAYIKPKQVILDIADASAAASFLALVAFQESRVPFTLVTGLSVYTNMLIQAIDATRDHTNSKILLATVTAREVKIASSATVSPTEGTKAQSTPGKNGGTKSRNAATPNANNTTVTNRAAQRIQRGDSPTSSVPSTNSASVLKRIVS